MHRRLGTWLCCLALLAVGSACAGPVTYGRNVVRDLSDVVDVRYGAGFGLGASVEAGVFKTGLGCSKLWYDREWFGRKSVEVRDGFFAHGLILGVDGDYLRREAAEPENDDVESSTGNFSIIVLSSRGHSPARVGDEAWFTTPGGPPPALADARVGGVVFLPFVQGGLYLNFGEAIDFCCSLVGYDLMHDDGYPKFFTPDPSAPTSAS